MPSNLGLHPSGGSLVHPRQTPATADALEELVEPDQRYVVHVGEVEECSVRPAVDADRVLAGAEVVSTGG